MSRDYPTYYEDAAHILRVLTTCGVRLNPAVSPHRFVLLLAEELETMVGTERSHADEGARLILAIGPKSITPSQERRLKAIAGTLIGTFLVRTGSVAQR